MNKILKEPLFYFLLLGAAFFVLYQQVASDVTAANSDLEEILVTEGHIQAMVLVFEKVWQRSPTAEELDGLIKNYVREEVLYREALAMGLDRDDAIIKSRLRQKIEFLSEDLAALEEPDDQTLQTYLDTNSETYRLPSRFSFHQVYLNVSQRGKSIEADALALIAQLREQDLDAAGLGDSLMIKSHFENETDRDIERELGRQFLQSLRETETGSWQGPIVSGFGLHIIYISERSDGKIPELSTVRDAVFRDWSSEKRKQFNAEFYNALRQRYKVTVAATKVDPAPNVTLAKVNGVIASQ